MEVGWHLNPASDHLSLLSYTRCAYHHDVIPLSSANNLEGTRLNCSAGGVTGQYVVIQLAEKAVLGLCEVTVMGRYQGGKDDSQTWEKKRGPLNLKGQSV